MKRIRGCVLWCWLAGCAGAAEPPCADARECLPGFACSAGRCVPRGATPLCEPAGCVVDGPAELSLHVPAGALRTATQIHVRTASSSPDWLEPFSAVYVLEPEGLALDAPARLVLTPSPSFGVPAEDLSFWTRTATAWAPRPGGEVSLERAEIALETLRPVVLARPRLDGGGR